MFVSEVLSFVRIDEHKEHLGLKLGTMGRNEKLPKAFTNQSDRVVILERAESGSACP